MCSTTTSGPRCSSPHSNKLTKDFNLTWNANSSVSWVPFPTSMDYSATFPRILKEKPDIVYALNWGQRQVAFVKQAREAGLDKKVKIVLGRHRDHHARGRRPRFV